MMTGAEAAEKDADRVEATQKVAEQAWLQRAAEEAAIGDELLTGIAAADDSTSESSASEVDEVVFATPMSPPQAVTPEASRKRTLTLVMRTPDKPRKAPTRPSTPTASEAQMLHSTPLEPTEPPASTAPARLDGRTRREGKNTAYIRAMAIERGRGRGGRGGSGRA